MAIVRTHAIKLIKYLLVHPCSVHSSTCILDIDAFGLLVSLVLASPSLYVRSGLEDPACLLTPPLGSVFDGHWFNLVLVLHLVQVCCINGTNDVSMILAMVSMMYQFLLVLYFRSFCLEPFLSHQWKEKGMKEKKRKEWTLMDKKTRRRRMKEDLRPSLWRTLSPK